MSVEQLERTESNRPTAAGEWKLSARLEPFDTYWQAPDDVEKGFSKFFTYYKANILPHLPGDKSKSILIVSCGPGYLANLLKSEGYTDVLGVDSDAQKIEPGLKRGLNLRAAEAFPFMADKRDCYDVIVLEQELNHLTYDEMLRFLGMCREAMRHDGVMICYGLNGANPLVGAENLAHNIDHFNTFTDHSLYQVLHLAGFADIKTMPLKLYVFWKNPLNYVGLVATGLMELFFLACFKLYGKNSKTMSKKIAATARKK